MTPLLRQFLAVLIALAVVSGTTAQLAHSTQHASGSMPCGVAMPMAGADGGSPMQPCKGMADCTKRLCCVADIALPARFAATATAVSFDWVGYWDTRPMHAGVARTPEPLPPRAG